MLQSFGFKAHIIESNKWFKVISEPLDESKYSKLKTDLYLKNIGYQKFVYSGGPTLLKRN